MTRRIVLTIVFLAFVGIVYELGWESGTTALMARYVEFTA
jgi:hypothetical protein